jgi:serine/threonine protein kinase
MLEINLQGAPLQSGSLRYHHLPEVPKISYKVYRSEELSVKVYDLPTEPKYLKIAQDFITNEHTLRIREGETPFILNSIDLLWDTAETAQIITSYASGGSGQHLLAGWSEESNNESNATLNPLPPDFVVSVAHNLASALECMHSIKTLHTSREVKTLHLDVKPANVFFLDNTRRPPLPRSAVLANFSSARETSPPDAVTAWPADESSAKYASPEMLESNEATEKSDIWSLGATLLALLTGLELGDEIHGYKNMWNFARETGGDAYVIRSAEMRTLSRETPDWDSSWVKNLPPKALSALEKAPLELRSLISSCLALHPANRPTAQELLNLKILKDESVLVAKYLDEVRQAEEKARQLALEEEIKKKEVGTRKRKTVNDWSELDTQIEQAFSQLAALKGQLNAFKKHQIEADPFDESAVPLRGLLDQIETSKHLMEDMIKVQGDSFQAQPRQNAIKAALAQKVSHLDAEFRKVHPSLIFEQKQYVIALRFNSYMAMWTELLQLLNGPQPMGANEIKRFKALASVLSDSLALKAERIQGSSITAATTSEVLEEYAEWRKKALLDDACMAPIPADKPPAPNVRVTLGSEKECPSLLSTHDMARGIYDRVRTLDTVLKGALAGTVTSYDLPALLTSDAVLLLHPKAESTLKYVRQLENDLTEHLEVCALRDSSMKLIEKVFNAVNLEAAITSEERDLLTFVQSVLQLVANNASQAACNSELKAGNSVTKVSSCLYLSADSSPIVSLASGLVLMQAAGDLVHKLHNDGLSQLRESPAGPPLVEQLESEAKNKEALEIEAQSKYEKALGNMETAKKAYDFALKFKIFKKEDIELRSCEVELERQKIFLKTAREHAAAAKQKAVQVRVKENTFVQERVQKLQAVTSECLNEMLRILREVLDPFSSAWRLHTKSVATNELASSSSRVSASPYTDALAIVRSVYIIGDDVLFNTAMKALTLTPRQSNAVQMKARKVDVDVALHFSIFDTYSMSVQEKWEYLSKSACSALSKLDQEKTSFTVHATAALIRLQVAGSGIFRSLRTLHGVGKHFSTPEEVLEIRACQANALGLMKRMLTTTKNLFKAALFHPPIPLEEEVLEASHQVAQVRSDLRSLRSEMYRYGDSAVLAVLSCDEYCGSAQLACLKYVSTVTPTGLKLKTELEAITKELHDRVEPDLLSNDEIKLTAAAMDLSNRLELAATSLRDLALKTAQVSTFSPHVVFTDARIALTSHLKPTLLVSRLAHVLWTSLLHPLADLVIHQRLQLPDASHHAMVNVFSALEPVLMSKLTAMSPENILALFDSDADSLNSLNTLPMSLRQLQIGFKEVHQSGSLISIATVLSAACEELLKQVMRLSVSKLRRTYESQVEAGKTQPLPKLLICHNPRGSRPSDPKIDQSAVKVADLLNNTLLQRTVRDQATKERIDDKEAAESLLDIEAEVWRAQVIHGAVIETFDSMLGLQDCAMDFSSSANIGGRFLRLVKKTSVCMLNSLKESKESLPHLIHGLFTLENTVLTQDVASGLWIAAKKEEESLKIVFDSLLRDTEEIHNTAKKLTEEAEAELQSRLSFYEKGIAQSQENEEKLEVEHKARQDELKAIYEKNINRYNSSLKEAQDSFNDWHQHLHSACGSFANASKAAIKCLCEHAGAYARACKEATRIRKFAIKELDSKVFFGTGAVIRIDFSEGIIYKNRSLEGFFSGVVDSVWGTKPPDKFIIYKGPEKKHEVSLYDEFVDLPLNEFQNGFRIGCPGMSNFIKPTHRKITLGVPLNKTSSIDVTVSILDKFVFKSPDSTSTGINASSDFSAPFDFSRFFKELDQIKYFYFACHEKVYDKPSPFVEAPFQKKGSSYYENFKSQVIKGINQELEDWRKSTPGKSILSLYSASQKVMNSDIPDIQRGMSDAICHNKSQNFILDVKKVGQLPQSISDMRVSVSRIMTNVRIKSYSHFEWSPFQTRPPLTESWTINMGKSAEYIAAIFTRMEKSIPKIRLIAAHLGYISASLCVISPIADLRTVAEDTDLAQNLLVSAKSSSESHESMNVDTVVESLRFEGMQRLLDTLVLRRKDQFAKQSSIIKLVSMLSKDDIVPADALPSTQIASFRCTMKSGKVSLISDMDSSLSFGAILEGDLTVQEQQVLLYNETDMHCNISLSINHGKGSWGVFSVSSSIVPLSPSESIFIHISARPQANAGVLRATLLASIDKVPDKIAINMELSIEKIDIRISTGASDVLDFGNMVIDATKVHSRPFRIFNGNSCPVRLKLGMQYLMGQKTGISLVGNDVREIAPQNVETVTVNVSPNKVADDFNGMGVLIAVGKPKPFFHRISVSGQVFAPKFTISSPTQGTCTPQSPVNMGTIENIGSSLSTTFLINNLINFEYEVAFSCTSATANNGVDYTTAFSVLPSKILLPISRGEEDEGVPITVTFDSSRLKDAIRRVECILSASVAQTSINLRLQCSMVVPHLIVTCDTLEERLDLSRHAKEYKPIIPIRKFILENKGEAVTVLSIKSLGPYIIQSGESAWSMSPQSSKSVTLLCDLQRADYDREGEIILAGVSKVYAFPYKIVVDGPDVCMQNGSSRRVELGYLDADPITHVFRLINNGNKTANLFLSAGPSNGVFKSTIEFYGPGDDVKKYPVDGPLSSTSEKDVIDSLGLESKYRQQLEPLSIVIPESKSVEIKVTLQRNSDLRVTQRMITQRISVIVAEQAEPLTDASVGGPKVIRLSANAVVRGSLFTNNVTAHKLHNDDLSQLRESPAGPPLVEQLESEAKNKEALEIEAQSKYEKALGNMETAKKAYDFALKFNIFRKEDIELRNCKLELERQKIFLQTARELSAAAKKKAELVRISIYPGRMTSGLFPLLADWLARPSTLSECASLDYIYLAILPLLQVENTSTIDAFVTTLAKDKFDDGVLGEASIEAAKDLCKACNTFTLDSLCDHLVRFQSSLQELIVSTKPAIVEQVIDVLLDSCVDSDYLQQLFLLHCRLVTYDIDEVATFVSASSSNTVSRFVSESLKDLKRPQRFNFFNNNVEHLAPVVVSLVQGLHFGKDVSTETDAQEDVTSLCGFIAALGKKDLFAILDAASRHLSQPLLQAIGAMRNYSNNQRILAWIALEVVAIEFSLINPSPAFIVEAFRSLVGFSDADGASHLLHSLYSSSLCNDNIGTAVFFAEKAVRCFKSSAPINLPPLLEVFRPRSVAKRNIEALELKELPSFIVSILPENAQGLRSSVLLDSKMSPAIRAAAILLDVHFIARNELNSDSSPVQVVIDVIQLAGESETEKLETLLSHMSSDSRERLQLLAQLVYEGAPLASILRSARNVIIKEANFLKTKEAADAASKCGSALDFSSPFTIATSFVDFAGLISPDWARTPQSKLITLLGKLKSHPSAQASLEYVDCACKAFGADVDLKRMIQKLRMFMEDNSPNVADLYKAVLPEQMALLATDFLTR